MLSVLLYWTLGKEVVVEERVESDFFLGEKVSEIAGNASCSNACSTLIGWIRSLFIVRIKFSIPDSCVIGCFPRT